MQHSKLYLFVSFIFLLVSCQTINTVSIEVVKPSKITLPASANSILLINSAITKPGTKFTKKAQQSFYALDTATTQNLVSSVGAVLLESPKFDSVNLLPKMVNRNYKQLLKPLSWKQLQFINTNFSADMILSLEAINIEDTIVNYSYFDGYTYTYDKSLVLIVNTLWRIYDLEHNKIIDKKIHRDTLAFDEFYSTKEYLDALNRANFRTYLSSYIASEIAPDISDRIAPYWIGTQRTYYTIMNDEMQLANQYVKQDDWISAAKIWQKYTKDKQTKTAAAAAYNMALVCEVQGELELALNWLEKSNELYTLYNTHAYMLTIKKRLEEKKLLDKQFGLE